MEDPTQVGDGMVDRQASDPAAGPTPVLGSVRRGGARLTAVIVAAISALVIAGALVLWPDEGSVPSPAEPPGRDVSDEADRSGRGPVEPGVPEPLLAAERYVAGPAADTLRALVGAVGGLDAVVVGEASGAFDLVRFDPLDHDRVLASNRSSYGRAENQDVNERWTIGETGLVQELWAPDLAHDFVHFNADGSITVWVNESDGADYAPRRAEVHRGPVGTTSVTATTATGTMYASRFTATADAVFALTGNGDYYSNDGNYLQLIADGGASEVLAAGAAFGWIDIPLPGVLVAYPRQDIATTAVWDTESLLPITDSPLAGRRHQRSAVSGDRRTAIGVTFDGELEQIDMASGRILATFGSLDPRGVDQPLTVNADGTLVTTVDRSGRVTLWWVGDDTPIASASASSAQPRWVSERYGARSASAVASSGERVALRLAARPMVPVSWTIVDTSADRWIARACELAGRALTLEERLAFGLNGAVSACI